MKRPEIDEFIQEEGSTIIENTVTGEKMTFFADEGTNLVLRSMLEDDVDNLAKMFKLSQKEKKSMLKKLKEVDSENSNFVVTEMLKYDENEERKIVATAGFAEGTNMKIFLHISKGMNHRNFLLTKDCMKERIGKMINNFYNARGIIGLIEIFTTV